MVAIALKHTVDSRAHEDRRRCSVLWQQERHSNRAGNLAFGREPVGRHGAAAIGRRDRACFPREAEVRPKAVQELEPPNRC